MSKKAVYSMVLFVVLMGVLGVSVNVHEVEAFGTITIKADGSIEGTTDIMTVDSVTYTFTANINDSIEVKRNNITIDGAGYTLQGTGSEIGIYLLLRSNVTIKNMEIKNFWAGVQLSYSSNNMISGNNITNVPGSQYQHGIYLYESSNNMISGNYIHGFYGFGIWGEGSSNNVISGNTVKDTLNGIWLDGGSNNRIYHNNFINHSTDCDCPLSTTLDAGYPLGGNYWDKYNGADLFSGQYQNETGSDGIGDTAYTIDANNTDNYPLMGMFSDFKASSEYRVQTICNSSISDFQFNGTAICFNVTGENDTIGFCRICVSRALMNKTYKVFVNGTEAQYNLLPCSNTTHSYLYFTYNHSTQEVIIIPEFPLFLILSLFTIATLTASIARRRSKRAQISIINPTYPRLRWN